jgi:hypothetical protein
MKHLFVRVILLLIVVSACQSNFVPGQTRNSEPVAEKTAELNDAGYEMYSSVLDTFIGQLRENDTLHGVIIVYGPQGSAKGTGSRLLSEVTRYMNIAHVPQGRFTMISGGITTHEPWTTTQLWIVPPGAKMPEPVRQPMPAADFSGRVGYMIGAQADGDIAYDSPSPYGAQMAAFAWILRRQPKSIGYLVVHQADFDGPGGWRRIAKYGIKILKEYGVDPTRVKVIRGSGTGASFPNEELWVLSKGERLPALD